MKKFYAILVAAVMSVGLFAAPTQAELQKYMEDGYYVACFQAPVATTCKDIYWMGEYVNWNISTPLEDLVKCEELTGANAGWYVAKVPADKGTNGKPIQLDECGYLTWNGQPGYVEGKPITLVAGEVTIKVFGAEYDLEGWSTTEPTIITIGAWKNDFDPCSKRCDLLSYTIRIYPPYCEYLENQEPTIKGSFNNWGDALTMEFKGSYFELVTNPVRDNFEFKFNNDPAGSWVHDFQAYYAENDLWGNVPASGNFSLTNGTEFYEYDADNRILTFDFSDNEKYRYKGCEKPNAEYTIVALNLPTENCPEAVEIIGTFDNMAGTLMNQFENGWWFVELEARPSDYFKIRGAGSWEQVIEIYNAENGEWTKIQDGQFQFGKLWTDDSYKGNPCKWIELDWSDNKSFRWTEKPRYKFDISCDNNQGKVYGNSGTYLSGTKLTFSAEANYGYHFVKWSDGNTNSSRTIILSEDMSLTAIFAPNTYTFSVSCDEKYGKVVADNGEYDYLTQLTISAEANYGYHFAKWSDGNTSNPRTIILKQDMNLTAVFAPNTYTIRDNSNQAQGYIAGAGQHEYLSEVTLIARANYGYHFTQWSDGVTESSRKVTVTQDLAFKALFAPNKYTFSASCDEKYGKVVAENGEYDYLTQLTITANANYGYHFVEWSDGNTSNPRVLKLTEDTELTAIFAPNTYTISDNSDKSRGYIANAGVHTYLSEVVLEATPNYGYQFVKWSDGKTNNPRTIIVTQDISLAAEFAIAKYGTCGDNNALIWTFDDKGVLTISGSGALNSNYTFGLEAPESMQKVVIESGVSSVGNGAFKNKTTLNEIAISHGVNTIKAEAFAGCSEVTILTLGANLQSIGANAFDGCKRIDEITVYAERVIDITETTFANIGNKKYVYVYVPEASLRKYQRDDYWSEFDLRVIGATTTTVAEDEVNVEPTTNTADVTWPAVDNAATYELTIKDKSGNVICTLIFNAQGQLTSIAFAAPDRGQYAAQVAGFTFTVTGLDSGSSYSFTMEAKDSEGEVLDTKEGSFTTAETGIATAIDNASVDMKPIKVIRNNQLFLLRGDKTYTVQGQEVR